MGTKLQKKNDSSGMNYSQVGAHLELKISYQR